MFFHNFEFKSLLEILLELKFFFMEKMVVLAN